jgi:DNA-directed RNA polymerase subunit RPC12/RpoP
MKESITKFDLEAAFKALDDIEIPVANNGIKANRPALTEIFSRKSKFDSLMEEYYDINDMEELDDAKEAREAEVAKAKLARIEKIVDLEADSPEDLLTSYVGKYIMQCPQCMTLFYKDSEDIVESEEDKNTVNVNEVCQHCGNETGYTLIGKVGEAAPGEFEEEPIPEATEEELPEEPTEEDNLENEDSGEELEDLGDLEELDLNLEDEEEDKQEESFANHEGEALVEELDSEDKELDAKLAAHNEYIEYLRTAISNEEEKLEKATNEQVKTAIQRNIDAFKADLESALPDAVKNNEAVSEEPAVEEASASAEEVVESLTESLQEEAEVEVSAEEFEELISSPEFKKPISDSAARAMINDEKEAEEDTTPVKESKSTYGCMDCGFEIELDDKDYDGMCPRCKEHHGFVKFDDDMSDIDEINESALETVISSSLVEAYGNVAGFRLTECAYLDNKFTIDGTIYFTSGNIRKATYTFNENLKTDDGRISLRGLNEKLGKDKQFILSGKVENKTLITESLKCNK